MKKGQEKLGVRENSKEGGGKEEYQEILIFVRTWPYLKCD